MYAPALIAAKAPERNELAALMASFTGSVQVLSHTERAPHRPASSGRQPAVTTNRRRAVAKREQEIADLMRANVVLTTGAGSKPRTPRQMRGVLRDHGVIVTSPEVERLAAKHGIKLLPPLSHE